MAKDKRTPMRTDMNDLDMSSTTSMTDDELKALQKGMPMPDSKMTDMKRKKSM